MEWKEIILTIVNAVITAVLPVITYYLVKFLKSLAERVTGEGEQKYFNDTLSDVFSLIITVVTSISQTYVDSLKEAGKFDKDAQIEAFNMAKDEILSLLNTEVRELLEITYGDLDKWLSVQIEATVRNLKSE